MPQNYERVIPDAPLPISMLPRAEQLSLQDLLLLTQPGNVQGHRTKAVTLQMLAAFLGNMNFDSIVFTEQGGRQLVLDGTGAKYTRVQTQSGITLNVNLGDSGFTIAYSSPNSSKEVALNESELLIKEIIQGLQSYINIKKNGFEISVDSQEQGASEKRTDVQKLDSSGLETNKVTILGNQATKYNIPKVLGWDLIVDTDVTSATYGQLKFMWKGGEGSLPGTNPARLQVPGLNVTGKSYFDKDVLIDADVQILKTLEVTTRIKTKVFNYTNITESSTDVNMQTFSVGYEIGDKLIIKNTGTAQIKVVLGLYGSGQVQEKRCFINEYCAMEFICDGTYEYSGVTFKAWSPIGNTAVTFSA